MVQITVRPTNGGNDFHGWNSAAGWLGFAAFNDGGTIVQNIDHVTYFVNLDFDCDKISPGEYEYQFKEYGAVATGGWSYALGKFTVNLGGMLTVNDDLSYDFSGQTFGGYDNLNYDKKSAGVRSGLNEWLTGVGRSLTGDNANYVHLVGVEEISASGRFADDIGSSCSPGIGSIVNSIQGLFGQKDNALDQLGSIKLNTEASINGGWPNDNNTANDNENRFAYMRAA